MLREVFDHIPVMMIVFGADGQIKLANRQWERTLGWSVEELSSRGEQIIANCHPDPDARQEVLDFIAEAKGEWADFKARVRDGRIIDTTCAVVALSDGGRILIGQEITERKRAEEQLRLSEGQLAESQRLAHIGSWNWDLRTNVVKWSAELYRIHGVDPNTFEPTVQIFFETLVHPEDLGALKQTLLNTLLAKEHMNHALRVKRPSGEVRFLHVRGQVVVDESGSPVRVYGTSQDVTELHTLVEQLRSSNEQLRALWVHLRSVREHEGTRIAREIHDELGSSLTSLRWELEVIDRALKQPESLADRAAAHEKLRDMMKLADATLSSVRRIASDLRPCVLDDLGLLPAIEWQAQQFEIRTGIKCSFQTDLDNAELDGELSTVAFRILQEALTNVLRHARATKVEIQASKEAGELRLTIRDNGRGITEAERTAERSLGLIGMQERARLVGGSVEIRGVQKEGTTITLRAAVPRPSRTTDRSFAMAG